MGKSKLKPIPSITLQWWSTIVCKWGELSSQNLKNHSLMKLWSEKALILRKYDKMSNLWNFRTDLSFPASKKLSLKRCLQVGSQLLNTWQLKPLSTVWETRPTVKTLKLYWYLDIFAINFIFLAISVWGTHQGKRIKWLKSESEKQQWKPLSGTKQIES